MILLERLKEQTLFVDFNKSCFYTNQRGHRKLKKRTKLRTFKGGRTRKYLFIRVQYKYRRRAYPLHCAIWIAKHMKGIPKYHDIDHIDRNTKNNHISNLRPLPHKENRATRGKNYKEERKKLEEFLNS